MQSSLKSAHLLQKYADCVVKKLNATEALLLYAQAASVQPPASLARLVPSIARHAPIMAGIGSSASGVSVRAPSAGASQHLHEPAPAQAISHEPAVGA